MLLNPKSIAIDREIVHSSRKKMSVNTLRKHRIFAVFAAKDKVVCK